MKVICPLSMTNHVRGLLQLYVSPLIESIKFINYLMIIFFIIKQIHYHLSSIIHYYFHDNSLSNSCIIF